MKKKILFGFLVFTLVALPLFGACAEPAPPAPAPPTPAPTPTPTPTPPPAPDKIVIGQSISLSGWAAGAAGVLDVPTADLWLQEVNAKGGIFVPQYNKRIPVELIRYDNKSDVATHLKLLEKLVEVDKVDLTLPPHGTDFHIAGAPLTNKYKMPWMCFTTSQEDFEKVYWKFPYLFVILPSTAQLMTGLVDVMAELGVKTAAVCYPAISMGADYTTSLVRLVGPAGIEIVMLKTYPMEATDLSPLLKEAKAANVDAFIAFSMPAGTNLLTEQAMTLGFNPKIFFVTIGSAFPFFKDKFGDEVVEGIMGPGGWNPGIPYPEAKEFHDKFLAMHGRPIDNFSGPYGYALLQVLEQAIAMVGFEDREALRDIIATETFDTTCIGPVKFVDQANIVHGSLTGQWQSGVFEAVGPKATMTAEPIYPKPPWPKK